MKILLVCTANQCRSPYAHYKLEALARQRDLPLEIASGGLLLGSEPVAPILQEVALEHGLDLSTHRSTPISAPRIEWADMVLAMAREHLREVVITRPESWGRTFTLREFVRRSGEIGARGQAESIEQYLAGIHEGRDRRALLGESLDDDIEDPMGGPRAGYERMITEVDDLLIRFVNALWPAQIRAGHS